MNKSNFTFFIAYKRSITSNLTFYKMKQSLLFISAFLVSGFFFFSAHPYDLFAQQPQTLVDGSVTHGGFGGPSVKFGDVAGSASVWVGGRGGWIMNLSEHHAISLGGGGYGLVTNHRVPVPVDGNDDLYALNGYGGFIFEYTNQSYKLIHFTVSSLIGGGGLLLRERNYEDVSDEVNSYFIFEPEVNAELNVTSFFRITAGASYRMTSGISEFGFGDSDFSGLQGTITLKFGGFL